MARDIVKVRKVAGSMVISLPQTVLAEAQISDGDRVLIETTTPNRLTITKEAPTMPTVQRAELELAVLLARRHAMGMDTASKVWQHNNSMEVDFALRDESVFELTMMERNREMAELDVEIASKQLEIHELQGAGTAITPQPPAPSAEVQKIISKQFPASPQPGPHGWMGS